MTETEITIDVWQIIDGTWRAMIVGKGQNAVVHSGETAAEAKKQAEIAWSFQKQTPPELYFKYVGDEYDTGYLKKVAVDWSAKKVRGTVHNKDGFCVRWFSFDEIGKTILMAEKEW